MQGDDVVKQPSFRIVPTTVSNEAATSGRLEYSADSNPTPSSNWGKVCDDCFDGVDGGVCRRNGQIVTALSKHNGAVVACTEMGQATGISLGTPLIIRAVCHLP